MPSSTRHKLANERAAHCARAVQLPPGPFNFLTSIMRVSISSSDRLYRNESGVMTCVTWAGKPSSRLVNCRARTRHKSVHIVNMNTQKHMFQACENDMS